MSSQVAFTVIRKISIESSEKRHWAPKFIGRDPGQMAAPLKGQKQSERDGT